MQYIAYSDTCPGTIRPWAGCVHYMGCPSLDRPPVDRSLLRDDVYRRLRDAITDGTFAPGEQLRDGELATWLGVSRTPVREALLRLAQGGLVVTRPGRSTVVSSLDARATRDARDVVAAMHALAVREAIDLFTAANLQAMRDAARRFAVPSTPATSTPRSAPTTSSTPSR